MVEQELKVGSESERIQREAHDIFFQEIESASDEYDRKKIELNLQLDKAFQDAKNLAQARYLKNSGRSNEILEKFKHLVE